MRAHDARVDLAQRIVGQAERGGLVAAQVVEQPVRAAREVAQHRAPAVAAQVERDRALVAVEGLEELAVARAEEVRADVAPDVAALAQVLDLDHLGAEIGEVDAARRAGAVLLDREDAQAVEGKPHRHGSDCTIVRTITGGRHGARELLRGLRGGRDLRAPPRPHHRRGRQHLVHAAHHEHASDPLRRRVRKAHRVRQAAGGEHAHALDPGRHERLRHEPEGDRQPRLGAHHAAEAGVRRRHALRRVDRARQARIEIAPRPGHRQHPHRGAQPARRGGVRVRPHHAGHAPRQFRSNRRQATDG